MKNSSIIIISIAIIIGFAVYGIIDSEAKKHISVIETNTKYKIEQLKIYSEMLKVSPKIYQFEEENIIQIPNFNYTYNTNKLDIKYKFARYENGKLVEVELNQNNNQ